MVRQQKCAQAACFLSFCWLGACVLLAPYCSSLSSGEPPGHRRRLFRFTPCIANSTVNYRPEEAAEQRFTALRSPAAKAKVTLPRSAGRISTLTILSVTHAHFLCHDPETDTLSSKLAALLSRAPFTFSPSCLHMRSPTPCSPLDAIGHVPCATMCQSGQIDQSSSLIKCLPGTSLCWRWRCCAQLL